MALMGLIRRMPAMSAFHQPVIVPPMNLKGLNSFPVAVFAFLPSRTYMKNFEVHNPWFKLDVLLFTVDVVGGEYWIQASHWMEEPKSTTLPGKAILC